MKYIFLFISIAIAFPQLNFAQAQYGGRLKYCEKSLPRTYDPITGSDDMANERLNALLFEGLFGYDLNRNTVGKLARSFEMSSDNRSLKIQLQENVLFSNGDRLTSDDVIKTVAAIRMSENTFLKRLVAPISDISPNSDLSLTVYFTNRIALSEAQRTLTFKILPGSMLNSLPLTLNSELARSPHGTGYYVFQDRGITDYNLTVNEAYKERSPSKGPFIETVACYEVEDPGTQVENLLQERVDLLLDIPVEMINRADNNPNLDVIPYSSYQYSFVAFNFLNETLSNQAVRLAMVYGFNRELALQRIYLGQGQLLAGPYPPGSPFYVPHLNVYEYSTANSSALLSNAGFSTSGDSRLSFSMIYPRRQGDNYLGRVIDQFVDDMRKIGITINPVPLEFDAFLERLKYTKNYDLALATIHFDQAADIKPLYHSDFIGEGNNNFISYSNPEVDAMLNDLYSSTDPSTRINIGRRIYAKLREEAPFIYLWALNLNAAVHSRVRNVRVRYTPFDFFGHIDEWYIKED